MKSLLVSSLAVCFFLSSFGYFPSRAKANTFGVIQPKYESSFFAEISNLEQGEDVSINFQLHTNGDLFQEADWITLVFPEVYELPDFKEEHFTFDTYSALSVEKTENNNVRIQLPITFVSNLSFSLEENAELKNPISEEQFSFTIFIEKQEKFYESETIQLIIPKNTVDVIIDENNSVNEFGWFSEKPQISFNSRKAENIYYSIDGNEYILFSGEKVQIQEGVHILSYFGRRTTGLKEKVEVKKWKIDPYPPTCTNIIPKNKVWINTLEVKIKFEIESISPTSIKILEKIFSVKDGESEITVSLKPGKNLIEYTVLNEAGYSLTDTLTYFVDVTAPVLKLFSPTKDQLVCGYSVSVIGKAEPACILEVNGIVVEMDNYGNFNTVINPEEGENTILVSCTDRAGNVSKIVNSYMYYSGIVLEVNLKKQKVYVNHELVEVNPFPFRDSKNGEIYLPIRFVAESLSYELLWDAKQNAAILKKENISIYVRPNDSVVKIVEGDTVTEHDIYYPPTVIDGNIMIPIEFTKKILGAEITYKKESDTVYIAFCK
ncbi:MAG: hypothetical protein KAH01_06725 [Caldisericia bacterium]|nr:hypothetical protein [Caldisericia bacterium]